MKDRKTAGILSLLLGGIGVHRFYLGQTKYGILYLLFCWTYIPMLLGFIDGILLFIRSDSDFDGKYNPNQCEPNPVYTPKSAPQYQEIKPSMTATLTVSMNGKTFQVDAPKPYERQTRDYDFCNHFKAYNGNYDYIHPNEASRRVERMRQSSRNWDNEKYHDLQNRSFSPTDKERLAIIKKLEGEELRQYFTNIFADEYDYVTSVTMAAIFEKLSIYDESFLLAELQTLQRKQISMWVHEKKRNGYFFTETVYETAWALKQGLQIEKYI